MNNLALVIFIYENARIYFKSLKESINNQSNLNFEVIFFNDDVIKPEECFNDLNVGSTIYNLNSNNPCDLRYEGLNFLIQLKFDYFIFHDCDDELSFNRTEVISKLAKNNNMIVNDLDIINFNSEIISRNIWSNRFKNKYFTFEGIKHFNFVGLGNTSVSSSLLSLVVNIPRINFTAVDWYIFYTLLKDSKCKAFFTSKCTTRYRQHHENTVGINNKLHLEKIISIKREFYKLVGLKESRIIKDNLSLPLKKNNEYPFWWELNNE